MAANQLGIRLDSLSVCGGLLLTGVDQLKLQYNEGVGGCFPMHYDTTGDRSRRALTLLLYCTDDWRASDGGELRLFPFPYAPVDVAPERRLHVEPRDPVEPVR